ncbi:hypothetical protein NLI96_g8208 [Meripilus lineatus]|uniref:Uncharacterized protein n=1 Tax=Meripilus lineatus TaxID=2056292 RepID=A0AAD5UXS1_9APHY|nr:hypothetical protein NLI96_g8208 [Physisporinus lineatus]
MPFIPGQYENGGNGRRRSPANNDGTGGPGTLSRGEFKNRSFSNHQTRLAKITAVEDRMRANIRMEGPLGAGIALRPDPL